MWCHSKAPRLEPSRQLKSQLEVAAEHVAVHRHPQTILEVRRVLLETAGRTAKFPPTALKSPPLSPLRLVPQAPTSTPRNAPFGEQDPTSAIPPNSSKAEPQPASPPR